MDFRTSIWAFYSSDLSWDSLSYSLVLLSCSRSSSFAVLKSFSRTSLS